MALGGLFVVLVFAVAVAWVTLQDSMYFMQRKSRDRRLADPLISKGLIKDQADFRELYFQLGCYKVSTEEAEELINQFAFRNKPFENKIRLKADAKTESAPISKSLDSLAKSPELESIESAKTIGEIEELERIPEIQNELKIGDRVIHERFGEGSITAMYENEGEKFAQIYFDFQQRDLNIALRFGTVRKV